MPKYLWRRAMVAALSASAATVTILSSQITTQAQSPTTGTPSREVKPGKTNPAATPTPMPGVTTPNPGGTATPNPTANPTTNPTVKTKKPKTIVDLAVEAKQYKKLVAALKAADLVTTLSGEGPFTLFAPNDRAFDALPKGTLEKLLKPENKETLKKILTYHVIPGRVMSTTLKAGKVDTVEGSAIEVKIQTRNGMVQGKKSPKSEVTINGAKVLKADVKASNGVVHVIDKVILPPNLKL
jgi:uncharacterized surface protein with fasciclin (FAS1) repeats